MSNKYKSLFRKIKALGYRIIPEPKAFDPVCGMEATKSLISYQYHGKIYYFCSDHCKDQFSQDPESHIAKKKRFAGNCCK